MSEYKTREERLADLVEQWRRSADFFTANPATYYDIRRFVLQNNAFDLENVLKTPKDLDPNALVRADRTVHYVMDSGTGNVETLQYQQPGESLLHQNVFGWYEAAVYWKTRALRLEKKNLEEIAQLRTDLEAVKHELAAAMSAVASAPLKRFGVYWKKSDGEGGYKDERSIDIPQEFFTETEAWKVIERREAPTYSRPLRFVKEIK